MDTKLINSEERLAMVVHHLLQSAQATPVAHLVPQIHLLAFWASWRGPGVPITVAQIRVDLRKMIGQVKAMIEADVNATLQCGQLHVLYGYLLQAQFYANQMSETAITLNATARHQAGYPTPGETIHGN